MLLILIQTFWFLIFFFFQISKIISSTEADAVSSVFQLSVSVNSLLVLFLVLLFCGKETKE